MAYVARVGLIRKAGYNHRRWAGVPEPCSARNGGGYTLEAELGISPNGYAEPDFMGWEVKQYGVRDFERYTAKRPVTLMTPEPTGGVYRDEGVEVFLHRFGYPDKAGKAGRINFGGVLQITGTSTLRQT